jgi:hypothetical protein
MLKGRNLLLTVFGLLALELACMTGIAAAESEVPPVAKAPAWQITIVSIPTEFSTHDEEEGSAVDGYGLQLTNVGTAPSNGEPIVINIKLPAGMTGGVAINSTPSLLGWECSRAPDKSSFKCEAIGTLKPFEPAGALLAKVRISPEVPADTVLTTVVTASGGGAPTVSASRQTTVNPSQSLSFGVGEFGSLMTADSGALDATAADHPHALTTNFSATGIFSLSQDHFRLTQDLKDVVVDLPPGVVGNPQVATQCPVNLLVSYSGGGIEVGGSNCPSSSQVGEITLKLHGTIGQTGGGLQEIPIFNMVPEKGIPAEFGFAFAGDPIGLYPTVTGSGSTMHIRVTTPGVPTPPLLELEGSYVTFFGDPATQAGNPNAPNAFFTNSSDCNGEPLVTSIHMDSYENPGSYNSDGTPNFGDPAWKGETSASPPVSGCERLRFQPSLGMQADTTRADEPTGLAVNLHVPQNPDPHGLATPPVKDVTVTLPAGVSLSPSAADGLQACSDAQIDLDSDALGSCPDASVLGTVKVTTPLLAEPLTGFVFLGTPRCNPCTNQDASDGNMFRLFIQAEGSGIVIKVPGTVYANAATGQLTTKFLENPQFPFNDLQVAFKGGLRAGLATPQSCGAFTATSDLTPWSTPYTPDATPSASFDVDWDGNGGACPASPPLTPSFSAGTSNPNAGQFSPLTLTFAREDRQQDLSAIQVKTPPGLLGTITGVPLCGEPQAALGTCAQASRIGTMTVAAGPGGHPFYTQGSIYLTSSYGGAPFGLSIVVPTAAGPFNLGNVVVRARINIDPSTTALTVTSEPLPQILDGIPLRLRTANVTIERPGFIFNPTNCAQQHITATISGVQGVSADVSAPFAVSGCAGLHFGPKFTVSTSGKTSRARGASLDAKLVFPDGAQSNIAKVKVDLPKQLPSELKTLQKACPDSTFATNPATCPAASVIGIAKAVTPILPVTLTGPAYFVSHGGAAFPDLVVVLQGEGVRVDLTATTFINPKTNVTSSTFNRIPDVPVKSFELYLPEGSNSALAANGNLCTQSLRMPTSFIAQDGAQLRQSTKIAVTGCPKAKPKKAGKASRANHRNAGHRGGK